jgi:hypothetical protein
MNIFLQNFFDIAREQLSERGAKPADTSFCRLTALRSGHAAIPVGALTPFGPALGRPVARNTRD